jgi:uncharacterized protein YecT (DUF1311 family)
VSVIKPIAVFLLGLLSISKSFAGVNCKEVSISAQVDQCAEMAMKEADSQLNSHYHQLMARLETQYQSQSELGAAYLAKVKEAQRAWVKLRDANCAVEAFEIETDRPAHATVVNNCITRMSQERSVELDKIAPSATGHSTDSGEVASVACPSSDFAAFLETFSERVDVQKAFVQQPLKLGTTVAGDPEPEMEKRSVSGDQIKFPLIPDRVKREADGLTLTVKEEQGNSATAILQKPDTDYVLEYRFVRGQCWRLKAVLDFSL